MRAGVGGGVTAEVDFNLNDPDGDGKVRIDYRPVHLYTLTDEVEVVPPKARTF